MTAPATRSTRPPNWQLLTLVVLVTVVVAAVMILVFQDDEEQVAAEGSGSTTTSALPAPSAPTVDGTFAAPPPQSVETTTTAPTTTTTLPITTTAAPTTSTTAATSTTSTTAAPAHRWADPGPTATGQSGDYAAVKQAMRAARKRWASDGPAGGYVYRTERICQCPKRYLNEISVDADDQVRGQRTVSGAAEADPPTVERLFVQIQAAIDAESFISVRFDRISGYPVRFTIDPDPDVADDEFGRRVDWVDAA